MGRKPTSVVILLAERKFDSAIKKRYLYKEMGISVKLKNVSKIFVFTSGHILFTSL